jgi:hypothetical protein
VGAGAAAGCPEGGGRVARRRSSCTRRGAGLWARPLYQNDTLARLSSFGLFPSAGTAAVGSRGAYPQRQALPALVSARV